MRWLILFLAPALLSSATPQFPAAAFYWDPTHVAVVSGPAPEQQSPNAEKLPKRLGRSPWGDLFALPGVHGSGGINTGDALDINLTGNFWVRATVTSFVYNKTQYQSNRLAIAAVDEADRNRYAAAAEAKLSVFLAESAARQRMSAAGSLRNPVTSINLPATDRAGLEAYLDKVMISKLREAMAKDHAAPDERMSLLLAGKATLAVDVSRVDLGNALGTRQQISATWTIGGKSVFSIRGWLNPSSRQFASIDRINGFPEDKAQIVAAISDWGEESLDDFEIENVFTGSRLLRHCSGYERFDIYLEQVTTKGSHFERALYGL